MNAEEAKTRHRHGLSSKGNWPGIWSEVLRVEKIGGQTDFFALGRDSFLAPQVVSPVRDSLNVECLLFSSLRR